jgi:hypothetical protein
MVVIEAIWSRRTWRLLCRGEVEFIERNMSSSLSDFSQHEDLKKAEKKI